MPRKSLRGVTLIELLIGMVLSLLSIVAIYQALSVWDGRRRTVTAGSSAQISGGIGMFELERDVQLAGMGFGNAGALTLGCTVNANNTGFATPAFTFNFLPVEIVEGASGAPDIVRVTYGNSAYVASIQKLQSSTATTKSLQIRTGFNAGDAIVVAPDSGIVPRTCALFEVTGNVTTDTVSIRHDTSSYTSFYTAASVTPVLNPATGTTFTTGEIYNMGPNIQRNEWAIVNGTLTRRNTLRTTTASEVTEGVVNLQAQYGVDGSDGSTPNRRIESAEWTSTAPASGSWNNVLSIRVAILARSNQLEKETVTVNAPTWAGGAFTMLNLDGSSGATTAIANDWHHYRYRVYETVVPLRNMIWGSSS